MNLVGSVGSWRRKRFGCRLQSLSLCARGAAHGRAARALILCALLAGGCGGSRDHAASSGLPPSRIICGSPAVTELVFALGAGERVVGVSDYVVHPPEAVDKPSIGGWHNPNRERMLMLRPDVIITQGRHAALAAFAAQYAIRFLPLKLDGLEDVHAAINTLSDLLDRPAEGAALNQAVRADIAAVARRVADRPPRRVMVAFGHTPGDLTGLATTGPGTFLDEMIALGGGTNIFSDAAGDFPRVSNESLLMRRPELILELHPGGLPPGAAERLRADWRALEGLPAVTEGRIVFLDEDYLMIPGARVGLTVARLARAIHPEAFDER